MARLERAPLYVVFVDLTKAYDSVDRTTLFEAMVHELGVAPGTVAVLRRMYSDVQACVLRDSLLSSQFPVRLGVLQGCPASPIMFGLFLDRLEAFLDQEAGTGTTSEIEAVWCAGLLIPLLLFADDIAIPSRSLEVLQRLVAALSVFCTRNKLVVNLGKTGWLVGGCSPRSGTAGLRLWFNRCEVTLVS